MKANEIRIGNFATINNPEHWADMANIPLKVVTINQTESLKRGIWTHGIGLEYMDERKNIVSPQFSQFIEFIKPILITKEWLIDFGFEQIYSSSYRLKFDHPCNFIGYDFSRTKDKEMEGFRYYGYYVKIEYVHQLQNLYFDLTGNELKYTPKQ